MKGSDVSRCLISAASAVVLLGVLWLCVDLSSESLAAPEGAMLEPMQGSATSQVTHTVYLPLVGRNFPACDIPPLFWASDAGGILLRWRWPAACPGGDFFRVYRTATDGRRILLDDEVWAITDPERADKVLGETWSWEEISETMGIADLDQLLALPVDSPMQAIYLARNNYRVALVYGWGYQDTDAELEAGLPYTYEVEARSKVKRITRIITPVVALAGDVTPLAAPTGLAVTEIISEDLKGDPDWAEAQKNRKGDRWIFLRWDATTTETASTVDPPVTPPTLVGYDIYRSTAPDGGYQRINEEPVVPMPATRPTSDTKTMTYELHDYYYKDDDPSLAYGTKYFYCVAPRDLLGQPLEGSSPPEAWLSESVLAVPQDTLPPRTPRNLSATPRHLDQKIVLTWTTQTTDTAGYRIYWSYHPTSSVIVSPAVDPEQHWMTLVDIDSPTTAVYTDTGALGPLEEDRTYWYRIRAFDEAGNLSAPSEPVFATLRDRVPPNAPDVEVMRDWFAIDVEPDVEDVLAFCSVNGGPSRLWTTLEPEDDEAAFHPQAEYSPAIRSWVTCTFQSVDASGNRSELPGEKGFFYGPSAPPPPAPIIKDISTSGNEEDGWAAVLKWEAEPAPGVLGFRVYRKVYGSDDPAERVDGTGEVETNPETRLYIDDSVQVGVVYSYTVAVYRPSGFYDPEDEEIHSEPRIYKVVPPMDCCSRPQGEVVWRDSTYSLGEGTHLRWTGDPDDDRVRFIVFRSLHEDGGYAQLTPPLTGSSYTDSDAEHDGYWYVVLQLDWTTGEVIARSVPWSAGGQGGASRGRALELPTGMAAVVPNRVSAPGTEPLRAVVGQAAQAVDLTPSDDAYVDLDHPSTNYGAAREMLVARTALGNHRTSLVRFSLSSIPAGSVVDRAVLSAYVNDASGNGGIDVTRLDGSWDERTVTAWTSIPKGPVYATAADVTSGGWVTWDVTALADEWVRALQENYGVALKGVGKMAFERTFTTKEGSSTLAPTLSISYTTPPEWLAFGDGFVIENPTYEQGSTWDSLTGEGRMVLGGGALPTVTYTVPFTDITAVPVLHSPGEGRVTDGSVSVPFTAPLDIDYPGGFQYAISQLRVSSAGGRGVISLTLPTDIIIHVEGVPYDPLPVAPPVHPSLTYDFSMDLSGYPGQSCEAMTPTLYFEMNPLPLRVVPTGTMTFTHQAITFPDACTQYEERFSDERPPAPDPDAGDGYLRPVYEDRRTKVGPVRIEGDGLYGAFGTDATMMFGLAAPYGLKVGAVGGQFEMEASKIVRGRLGSGGVMLDYYRGLGYETVEPPEPTEGVFIGEFNELTIGTNGSLHGEIEAATPITWSQSGGFVLDEPTYQLFLPPIESEGMPYDNALASWSGDDRVQPGVNRVTDPGESVDFTWMNCGTGAPVTFPEGVETDMYLRRGGVSDIFTATISPGDGVETELYGYPTTIKGFRLSFCDNYIFDSDVAADIDLYYPSSTIIPLIDVQLNSDTACVESGEVSAEGDPLTLSYWQAVLHPTVVAFRDTDDSDFQGRALWILGGMDVPHLSLLDDDETAAIPLETCLTPLGRFHVFNLVHQEAHYTFDGFGMLLSGVRLSRYARISPELPEWDEAATLGDPPSTHRGFMELEGTLLTPLFGSLEDEGGNRPKLQFRTDSDFVGFTSRPRVKRGWTAKAGLGFKFDLLYAHAVDGHDARFLAWDQETFLNVDVDALEFFAMDWATVISPGETGIYFGLSTVPALARSLAEMTISPTVPTTFTEELSQAAQSEWFPALGISETLSVSETQGYLKLTEAIWEELDGPEDVSLTLDEYITHGMEISTPMGGGTTGKLKEWGVDFSEVRGQAAFSPVRKDGELVDWHLEELHVSLQFTISWGITQTGGGSAQHASWADPYGLDDGGDDNGNGKDDEKEKGEGKFIRAKRLTFRITRDGEYALVGQRVRTNLTDDVKDIDFALLIATEDDIRVEGGVVLYDYVIQGVKFEYVGAVLGIGEFGEGAYHGDPFFYIGGLAEAKFGPSGGEYTAGGAILIGTIYTESYVLRQEGFGDLLDRLSDTGEQGDLLIGAYVRVYGDFPIYKSGCMYQLTAGGEVAAWFFAARAGDDIAWGGRLRAYITGKILCVVSARGDLTLEIASGGHPSGTKSYYFEGSFWVAGGVGWCEPKKWKSWESRWWKDSWCWCCGANITADYNLTEPDAWYWDADADYE